MNSFGKAVKHMLKIISSLTILQLFIVHFLTKICSAQYIFRDILHFSDWQRSNFLAVHVNGHIQAQV